MTCECIPVNLCIDPAALPSGGGGLSREEVQSLIEEALNNFSAAGQTLPVLSLIWSATGAIEPGFLDISQDNGLLARADFPAAWAKLEQVLAAGNHIVVEDAVWLAEKTANNGVCGKFSKGDGLTTFRVPLIAGMEIAAVGAGHLVGSYQPDQMRPITGNVGGTLATILCSGAFSSTSATAQQSGSGTVRQNTVMNSSLLGIHYSGEDTHSKRIFAVPLLKM